MILGLDYGGVISRWREGLKELSQLVLDSGGKVYVVSWNDPILSLEVLKGEKYLADDFPYTEVFVNEEICPMGEWKAELCENLRVDLFIDDKMENIVAIQKKGIMAIQAVPEIVL